MKKFQTIGLAWLIIVIGILAALKINFPPNLEQLRILNTFRLNGYMYLWILRMVTLVILYSSLLIWRKIVEKIDISILWWSVFIIFTTPVFFVLSMLHPIVSVKLLVSTIILHLGQRYFPKNLWLTCLSMAIFMIGFNILVLGNKPAIFNQFSIKDAQAEVTARITNEDSLITKISLPLWWRRIAYNKYFFVYKNVVGEFLPFFDLESIFFQEIHPLEQKSIVMFYWVEMYLLIFGIYYLVKKNNKSVNKFVFSLILVSWIDFVFSEGSAYLRLIYVIFPVSIVMATGIERLRILMKDKYVLAKITFPLVILVLTYGILINYFDLTVRSQKWFDNRPLVFQFWFSNLEKVNINNVNRIQISSLVGDSKAYCYFYIGKICDQDKFVFKSFDLSSETAIANSVYAGFAGEFVGPKFKNDIDPNWENETKKKDFEFIGVESLYDTVAYKYGNDIGLAIKK